MGKPPGRIHPVEQAALSDPTVRAAIEAAQSGDRSALRSMTLLSTRVRQGTARRVADAAKAVDQPVSAWLRMAIIEKLNRDATH